MEFYQKEIILHPFNRGFHLITSIIERETPEIKKIREGQLSVFMMHTSASLTVNENADPSVRHDFEAHINKMVPENRAYFMHTLEGPDDMPAHIKASLMGNSIQLPVKNGQLHVGTWQGIYLCEHRNHGGRRRLTVNLWGNE